MMLHAVLFHLLSGTGYGTSATVAEWLDNWTVTDADDARIAYGLRLALGLQPAPPPGGITITVEWCGADPVVHYGRAGGDLERAELPDLIAAARHLLAADNPPYWPDVATPKIKPVQMSLF